MSREWRSFTDQQGVQFSTVLTLCKEFGQVGKDRCFQAKKKRVHWRRTKSLVLLSVEIGLFFHRIVRKAFQGSMHGKIYSGGNRRMPLDYQFPISLCPAMKKYNHVFSKAQTKSKCPEFLLHIKA